MWRVWLSLFCRAIGPPGMCCWVKPSPSLLELLEWRNQCRHLSGGWPSGAALLGGLKEELDGAMQLAGGEPLLQQPCGAEQHRLWWTTRRLGDTG